MSDKRQSWDQYFMDLAEKVSERATCDRLHVGCVLVKDKQLISSGYNGSLSGQPHCDEVGHLLVGDDPSCVRVNHAERNAICQAAKLGIATDGAIAYCNWFPCFECLKTLIAAGIKKIYYKDVYRPDRKSKYPEEILNIIPLEQLK